MVSGLPDAWKITLTSRLAAFLALPQLSSERLVERGRRKGEISAPEQFWLSDSTSTFLLTDHASHVATLKQALAEAQTQVLIASAFADADVITTDLAEYIKSAVARGVRVDLLWGYGGGKTLEEHNRTINALLALRKACSGINMLRFNQEPTGSHAKLLAWDAPKGLCVCVGSHNWLSVRIESGGVGATHRELSVLTGHPGVASDVCTTIAGLWGQPRLAMSAVPDVWHHTAGLLEKKAADQSSGVEPVGEREVLMMGLPDDSITIRQVRDQEHEALMRDMLLTANRRVAVISHKLGPKATIRLASLPSAPEGSSPNVEVRILAGEAPRDDSELLPSVEAYVKNAGGKFSIAKGLHAKVVLADDAVLISSYNFLSADPFGTATDTREVGLYLRGKGISDSAWAWVERLG